MESVDWQAIKIEYITDPSVSYRSLAEKYEVSRSTLEKRARREGWPKEREASCGRAVKKAVKAHENRQKKRMERVVDNVDRLLDCVEQAVGELDRQILREVTKIKKLTYGSSSARPTKETLKEKEKLTVAQTIIDRSGLKAITSALKDIKDILAPKDELDKEEQKARISALENRELGVVLLAEASPPPMPPEEEG